MVPHTPPDVSPFERPLTDRELNEFSRGFVVSRTRVFSLPHVNFAQVLPVVRNGINTMYRVDRALLRRFPSLQHFATGRVIELIER